jgi:hypothetical protein
MPNDKEQFVGIDIAKSKIPSSRRGSGRLSLFQKQPAINGSEHPISEPLFIITWLLIIFWLPS